MPGAALYEGLFFSFEEPLDIETIQFETLAESADFVPIEIPDCI